jgi:predicted amidohydrolase
MVGGFTSPKANRWAAANSSCTHREHANILLTPEWSLSGQGAYQAEEVKSALANVTHHARDKKVGLALGTNFLEEDGVVRNELRIYDQEGNFLGYHAKIPDGIKMKKNALGVSVYDYSVLRTSNFRGIKIGGLLCNDLWCNPGGPSMPDPHLTMQLSEMGCKIIFHGVNRGRSEHDWTTKTTWNFHRSNLILRASAAKVSIVTVDISYPGIYHCSAPSGVLAPTGKFLIEAKSQGEDYLVYDIEL